ncbi:putative signal transduction histidine-protein kinase [Echria macrotheca]|uniref:Signal transduction histidine-protein kinase n=1 Tax=Echria macrotheca TaxID=438768 RepID=A0AAJ0BK43_9PEZI|nr:putative signal transduction histidine-protein kinase [Echria macrotheca]
MGPAGEPPPAGDPSSVPDVPGDDDGDALSTDVTTPGDPSTSGAADDTNPAASPTCISSWSASSDRQLGQSTAKDPADRVFPIRSVISVEPTGTGPADQRPSLSETTRVPGGMDSRSSFAGRPSLDRRATPFSAPPRPASASLSSRPPPPPTDRTRQRRMNTMSGSLSSIQADVERQATVRQIPFALDTSSDDGSANATEHDTQDRASSVGRGSAEESGKIPKELDVDSLYTHRFKHVITGEGHAVITGRDGTPQRCEDEPIHTPGAIQAFGLMIAIREEPDGRFQVRYVSENSARFIGYTPQELFLLIDFLDILTDEQADNLLDHIDFIRDEDADPAINGPEVFSLSIKPARKQRPVKLWCAIHLHPSNPEMVICEFEMDDDRDYPLRPPDEDIPDVPEDTLQANPTMEELTESTEVSSRPLRVLRSARKRRGEAGAMQVFDIMSQVQEQLANAPNLEKFLKILVGIVKELTGFHRVMVYQFDSSFNGKVVTELVDPAQTRDLYKGLHFPASDIPRQARELYKLNRVRLLYDRDLESARIVCRTVQDLETPLDMTHSYLRAMSPIHLKYLANMAVRSSMSISINAFGDLWGLIACHSYGPKGMRVSFPIRKMCRLVGENASRNIERLSYASRLQARKLINTVPTDKKPTGYIIASSDDLIKLFDADFGMLSIREETKILGKIQQYQEALAMLEYLRLRKFTSVVVTQDIKSEFRDLRYPPGFAVIAGLLYVPLSVGGNDFIVFFRKGQVKEVKWAGNPYEKTIRQGTESYLEPRKSFRVWHEMVLGKCREWSDEQVETAAVLCLVYGKFIEVWRQKEAALQNSRLTRLLLANSAHEVRTPLNAIINYLEIALEGSLDQETRDNLARSHSASKSLIYVINDLLDLTKTEEGQNLIKDEIFDLPACIREGTDPFKVDARRKGIDFELIEHPGLPRQVFGDQRRVRQAVANVTANAVQHTSRGSVKVELYVAEAADRRVWVDVIVQDTGDGMNDAQLDALFRDLEQVSTDGEYDAPVTEEERPKEGRTLGLGLAVVARILRNMDGQLRLKSEPGKGSRFVIQLPFELPENGTGVPASQDAAAPTAGPSASASSGVVSALQPTAPDGEVTLVDRGGSGSTNEAGRRTSLSPKKSFDETRSISSQRSIGSRASVKSSMSDAERLIDAIQTPLTLGDPEPEVAARQRGTSRGMYFSSTASHGPASPAAEKQPAWPHPPRARSLSVEKMPGASNPSGTQPVTDSKVPIKPVRVPDEYQPAPEPPQPSQTSGVVFQITTDASEGKVTVETTKVPAKLHVLVAEDDPINVKVLCKRLLKAGHEVSHAVNGEDCAMIYQGNPQQFDVVLMDMQMPIVDGLSSTKMIRAFEQSGDHSGLSKAARHNGHIPVIAVSASLVEREKDSYVQAGFDGWILKPIDFKRLEKLLLGIVDDGVRNEALYVPGQWEKGGWFTHRGLPEPRVGDKMDSTPAEAEPANV